MRLLTHNSLRCVAKDAPTGYPLGIEITDMEVGESEVNMGFIKSILPSLNWAGVLIAANAVGFDGLPLTLTSACYEDKDFIRVLHKLLLDVHVLKGTLVCPDTKRQFPIEGGIPNMK